MGIKGTTIRQAAETGGHVLGQVVAVALGVALMIAGLALSVPMVTLPVGLPLGLAGVLLLLWGLASGAGRSGRE
jgi:hypothetical protein